MSDAIIIVLLILVLLLTMSNQGGIIRIQKHLGMETKPNGTP